MSEANGCAGEYGAARRWGRGASGWTGLGEVAVVLEVGQDAERGQGALQAAADLGVSGDREGVGHTFERSGCEDFAVRGARHGRAAPADERASQPGPPAGRQARHRRAAVGQGRTRDAGTRHLRVLVSDDGGTTWDEAQRFPTRRGVRSCWMDGC